MHVTAIVKQNNAGDFASIASNILFSKMHNYVVFIRMKYKNDR